MKGKTKTQRGITLVALIITIVILLILAAVAVATIQNDGILSRANEAATQYNQKVGEEGQLLGNTYDYLNSYFPGSGEGEDDVATVTPQVGQYVEYDVIYDDMYNSTSSATKTFGKTDGWRYLGTDETGNHLLISTGVPMILNYNTTANDASAQWWDTTRTDTNAKMAEGLKKNLANIPYAQVSAGTTSNTNKNTMIGLFGDSNRTTVGDYFKVTGKTYSNSIKVRTLTLEELNRAVNSAMEGETGYTQRAESETTDGFMDIPSGNTAYGLFDLSDIGLSTQYYYWLASPQASDAYSVHCVHYGRSSVSSSKGGNIICVRPVVVLPSDIQFTDSDNNTILEIK